MTDPAIERHERCRDHRQTRSSQSSTTRLGTFRPHKCSNPKADKQFSISNLHVLPPVMVSMKDSNGSATPCVRQGTTSGISGYRTVHLEHRMSEPRLQASSESSVACILHLNASTALVSSFGMMPWQPARMRTHSCKGGICKALGCYKGRAGELFHTS